ncbi:hypothetical protein GF322_02230 [Candidatus Dependentiae bacterium]|nr:hypothetical protein [Candidatus Dependentiae bacterium]
MEKQISFQQRVFVKKEDEKILVIEREKLFVEGDFNGIKKINFDVYQNLIEQNKQFLWRSKVETNTNYKQIIPYLIFSFQNKLFLMKRRSNASDVRLQDKYSLGIGGHIREDDIKNKSIFDWAKREFNEEINYSGNLEFESIGLLNDDSNSVGLVHIGFVFLLKGGSDKISIKDEHTSGELLQVQECQKFYDKMESWSKIVFNYLVQNIRN